MKTQIIKIALLLLVAISCNSPQNTKTDKTEKSITDTYWKLTTLEGKDIKNTDHQVKEIHFILQKDGQTVSGFTGCNFLNGTFNLEDGNRVRFLQMATTMKSCPDVDINEQEFLQVFELADNYTIHNDFLSLNVGRRAPLAVFEAVFFN